MSDFAQYENARHLGEVFAETVPGMHLLAVRDSMSGDAEVLLVKVGDREVELSATFDELTAAHGSEDARKALFARWTDDAVAGDTPTASFLPHKAKAKK